MPSIKVTPTKGLFQTGGTSVIPNGSLSGEKRVVAAKTANYTVVAADSGKIIRCDGASPRTITLPSPVDHPGFSLSVTANSAQNHIVTSGAANVSLMSQVATGDANTRAHGVTSLTLAGAIGDRFEIYSDGTFWVVKASTDAAITTA
jgi:hypothetical protein